MKMVWLSRPRRRAILLARALQQHNIQPLLKPAMRIVNIVEHANDKTEDSLIEQLMHCPQTFDLAIFVSEEAVHRLRQLSPPKNASLTALSIGAATQQAAATISWLATKETPGGDSEELLKSPWLQPPNIKDKKIAIIGGTNGDDIKTLSPLLCESLQQRGAHIFPIAVYRRLLPPPDKMLATLAAAKTIHAAVAYSGDTAANMLQMTAPNNEWLRQLPLFVIHPKIAAAAKKLHYKNPIIAAAAPDKMAKQIADFLA